MRISIKILLTLVVFGLIACGTTRGRPLTELTQQSAEKPYEAHPGDVLSVNVWGEPQLSREVVVREDGRFTMPLINDVIAQGKTLQAISAEVTTKLAQFVPGASVVVSIAQTAPIRYYLLGAFQKPGEYRSLGKITLLQAIATGGGFAPFANESDIALIRKSNEGDIRYVLDYNRVLQGKEPNPELSDGDTVSVQ